MIRVLSHAASCVFVLTIGCDGPAGECPTTPQPLSETDVTWWGTVVGDDMAELAGQFEGTWTWDDKSLAIDIPNAGMEIPATAYIEIDPDSYRYEMSSCTTDKFHADGTLIVVDQLGQTLLEMPLPIRTFTDAPPYFGFGQAPLSALAADLEPRFTYEFEGVVAEVFWTGGPGTLGMWIFYLGENRNRKGKVQDGGTSMIATFYSE